MCFKVVFYYKVMPCKITRFITHGPKFPLNYCRQFICFNSLSRSARYGLMKFCYFHINSFVCSFWRLTEGDKTNKRQNEISFLRLFVLSPSPKHDRTTKRQSYREISKFDLSWLLVRFVVCSFCRLPQGAKTTERQCDKMRFCGYFV